MLPLIFHIVIKVINFMKTKKSYSVWQEHCLLFFLWETKDLIVQQKASVGVDFFMDPKKPCKKLFYIDLFL